GLLDDALLGRDVDQLSLLGDAAAVQDVELRLAERRGHLVLHHLHLGAAADHLVAVLEGAEAADVEPDRGVELERVAARRGLRVAEQDADLHADLVDEDDDGPRLGDGTGQLAERLRHEPRLEAHLRIAHIALDLGARNQGSDGIDDQHVERARARAPSPSFMMAPLPNGVSIWLTARSIARSRFTSMLMSHPPPHEAPAPRAPVFRRRIYSTLARGRSPAARPTYFQARAPRRG